MALSDWKVMSKNGKAIYNLSFQLINRNTLSMLNPENSLSRMKRLVGLVLVFLSILSTLVFGAGEILVIDQPKVRLAIPPGGSDSGVINVENPASENKEVRVYTEDWYYVAGGDGSKEFRPAGTLPLSSASWITVAPTQFNLPARSSMPVHWTVSVPRDASGGHYSVVFFESLIARALPEAGGGVNVAVRVGALFYIEPKGTIERRLRLRELSLAQERKSIDLNAQLYNTGNVDISGSGVFNIIDAQGIVYARGEIGEVYTLPGDNVQISGVAGAQLRAGTYDLVITLKSGAEAIEVVEADLRVDADGTITSTLKN